jgi:hypothetical protein
MEYGKSAWTHRAFCLLSMKLWIISTPDFMEFDQHGVNAYLVKPVVSSSS